MAYRHVSKALHDAVKLEICVVKKLQDTLCPLLIGTPLLKTVLSLLHNREVSFSEREHYIHSRYLVPRIMSFLLYSGHPSTEGCPL